MSPTLFVFGDLCVDIVAVSKTTPRAGDDATLQRLDVVCGGSAFNCAIAAARAGACVTVIGLVGQDEFGHKLVARLQDRGVNTASIQTRHGRTGTVVSITSPGGERTLYSYRGVNTEVYGTIPQFKKGDGLYLSGYSLQDPASRETAEQCKRQAQASGAICLLDPSFQAAASLPGSGFLQGLDWITPNQREAELMAGSTNPAALRALGATNAAVTLGAQGCRLALADGRELAVPAIPAARVTHTTGAGDAFCGGLLAALLSGRDPEVAAQQATRAAALAIAHNE